MCLKHSLRQVQTDRASFRHGRLLFSGDQHHHSGTPGPSGRRPPHHSLGGNLTWGGQTRIDAVARKLDSPGLAPRDQRKAAITLPWRRTAPDAFAPTAAAVRRHRPRIEVGDGDVVARIIGDDQAPKPLCSSRVFQQWSLQRALRPGSRRHLREEIAVVGRHQREARWRSRKRRISGAISSSLSSSAKWPVSSKCNSASGRSRR